MKKKGDGGVKVSSSSKTKWRQTPTSLAVDKRKYKKDFKKWAEGGHKRGEAPIQPPPVGAKAVTTRKTKSSSLGNNKTRTTTKKTYSGPGGMMPKSFKSKSRKKK